MRVLLDSAWMRRLSIASAMILVLTMAGPMDQALAYSCSFPYECYGAVLWGGSIDGATTSVQVVPIYVNQGKNVLTNEIWVIDPNAGAFVESGYWSNLNTESYFWGNLLPGSGTAVSVPFGIVPSSDYGNLTYLELKRDNATQWHMKAVSNNVNYTAYSYPNNMQPIEIQMGMELQGTSGASAQTAHFYYNQYVYNGQFIYQQYSNGNPVTINPGPTHSGWIVYPPPPPHYGGEYYTQCGC